MIRFDGVSVKDNDRTILDNTSFEIGEGEKAVFYGKSASGKTTILTTIVGGHIPAAGTVFFKGASINRHNIVQLRRAVAYIGQEPVLGADLVRDAVMLPFSYRSNRDRVPEQEKIYHLIKKLHLDVDILGQETKVLSGGEKQRLAILRALLQQKSVFILDEITSALDPASKAAVLELFRSNTYTIVSVSHDPQWLEICSTFFRVDQGRIVQTPCVEH